MERLWEAYKKQCDNKFAMHYGLNMKTGDIVGKEVRKAVTYTVVGFCTFIGIAVENYYNTYGHADEFRQTLARIRQECEVDAREKFELGIIPTQLAPLWMSNYGYSTKNETSHALPSPLGELKDPEELRRKYLEAPVDYDDE